MLTQTVSVDIRLERATDFNDLLVYCADIFNRHVDYCIDNNTRNKKDLNAVLYVQCRADFPDVPSAMIQAMRDTAVEAVTA